MNGGGGGTYHPSAVAIEQRLSDANNAADRQAYETEVNRILGDILQEFNDRNAAQDRGRLNAILAALHDEGDETIELRFGGSIRKHTYVDGLSDVDILAIMNEKDVAGRSPTEVRYEFARRLGLRIADGRIAVGELAI